MLYFYDPHLPKTPPVLRDYLLRPRDNYCCVSQTDEIMDQSTATVKVMEEIRQRGIIIPGRIADLKIYFDMLFCIGYVEGARSHSNQKPVIQLTKWGEFVADYPSAAQASRKNRIDHTSIVNCCKSKQHTAGGYLWKYKMEETTEKRY